MALIPGLTSITFRQLEPEAVIALAASCGLRAIEWGGDVHAPPGKPAHAMRLREQTRSSGLTVSSYGSYYRAGPPRADEPSFEPVLETAIALGAPTIRVWAGRAGSAHTPPGDRHAVADDLRSIASRAEQDGVAIGIEFHADTLTDTQSSAIDLIEEIAHPNAQLYWQPPNGMPADQAADGLVQLLPHISNLHIFEWTADNGQIIRHPLSEGGEHWLRYLRIANGIHKDRFVLIEFVEGDRIEQLRIDAKSLLAWIELL